MKNQQLIQMAAMVKTKYPLLLMQGVRVNDLIVAEYQEATGQKVFKTFNEWLEVGQVVKKGEKEFLDTKYNQSKISTTIEQVQNLDPPAIS